MESIDRAMDLHFGEHLLLDGYDGDPAALDDARKLEHCIWRLCQRLGMHALSPTIVLPAPDNQLKDPGGWSGFVVLAESHISIHTFPRRRFLSADVYTCRNGLDPAIMVDHLTATFLVRSCDTQFVRRGLRYPVANLY